MSTNPERVRVDKWLWAARFFKTRAMAAKACELGRIQILDHAVKASREVKPGEFITIRLEAGETFTLEVLKLSEVRGPAAVAQTLYHESEESKALRARRAEERRAMPGAEATWEEGRPSKRDRRAMDRLRGRR